jgi:hypothetical protein
VESALCAFVHEFQQTVGPHLLALVQQVQSTDATADLPSLTLKEAGRGLVPFNASLKLAPSSFIFSVQGSGVVCI